MILTYAIHALVAVAVILILVTSLRATSVLSSYRNARTDTGKNGARERTGQTSIRDSFNDTVVVSKKKARIRCNAVSPSVRSRFEINGFRDCRSLNVFFRGNMKCANGCLGLGTCAQVCPVDAIVIRNGRIGVLERCNGCGLCVHSCPKSLIEIVARSEEGTYPCAADKGEVTADICSRAGEGFWLDSAFSSESDFKRAGS